MIRKLKYPLQVIDLRFQVDHINPKKIHLFEEYRGATNNASLFKNLIRHREIKMISDELKSPKLLLFKMIILSFEDFMKK